ncbi:hypothetical protein MASR1M90_07200 [Desulfovibrionales bacterium]
MNINIFNIHEKFNYFVAYCYTAVARSQFGNFGSRSILYYPSRIYNSKNIYIGDDVLVQSYVWLNALTSWLDIRYKGKIFIHDNAIIMNNVQISSAIRIEIGKYVGISRNCLIVDHHHDYTHVNKPIMRSPLTEPRPVIIEDESFVGINCVIAPGVTIGRHSFIAANSIVTTTIPPYSFAAGAPAKVLRTYNHAAGIWEQCRRGDS